MFLMAPRSCCFSRSPLRFEHFAKIDCIRVLVLMMLKLVLLFFLIFDAVQW